METNLGCLLKGHRSIDSQTIGDNLEGFQSKCSQCNSKLWTPPSKIDPDWNWILYSDKPGNKVAEEQI